MRKENKKEIIFSNFLKDRVLWSQTPDTDWYRQMHKLPETYYRVVATWPNEEKFGYMPRKLSRATLTGWGREVYFIMTAEGDRKPTRYEKRLVRAAMLVAGATDPTEDLQKQKKQLCGLASQGLLTSDEVKTLNSNVFDSV